MRRPSDHEARTGFCLTGYHRRCLAQRIGECDEALEQAVCALFEAEAWVPEDRSLHALTGLLQAAHGLTELACHISRTAASDADFDQRRSDP